MNNMFNVTGLPSDGSDDDLPVGGVQPTQSSQPAAGRPRKAVSYQKPFEKYMEEGEAEGSTAAASMASPLLPKSGKGFADVDLGGTTTKPASIPFPSSFKNEKGSPFHSSFPKKSASPGSHKANEPGTPSFSTKKTSATPVKKSPKSVGGEALLEDKDLSSDSTSSINSVQHKEKDPDEVVWGATSASINPANQAVGGEQEAAMKVSAAATEGVTPREAMALQPKLKPEIAVKESLLGKDKERGITVESPKSSKKAEDAPIPVLGAEVLTRNVVPPAPVNLAVSGVGPMETKAPTVSRPNVTLQSLVEQIVSRVDTLTRGDRMESVITLKQSPTLPPGFENATIRLTSVATARGEVNISFGGLTQSAVQLVQSNQNDLLNALATRGVTVHIFSVSTQQDPIAMQASSADQQQQQQQQSFGQAPQQQQRRQPEQEEGEYT